MADYMTRTRTKTRHEYYLVSPTTATEFSKALNAAIRDMEETGRKYFDNSITVEAGSEHVIIYWEQDHIDER